MWKSYFDQSNKGVPTMEASVKMPDQRSVNWGMLARVGIILALVLALIGYAAKVTYESVIQGGVVNEGDYYKVELKAMSNFEMDQTTGTIADVPERFRGLDGKKVLLQGEVAPIGETAGDKVNKFTLCYSVARCCFGGAPKVQHFVACQVPGGNKVTNYVYGPQVNVYGTLHIKVIRDGGAISRLYQMDVERVEPVS
jgi:hypothetical protein